MEKFQATFASDSILEKATDIGILALEILGTIVLCWVSIRLFSHLAQVFFQKQTEKRHLSMSERKAKTLNTITSSVLKYLVYFVGLFTILNLIGVDDKSLLVVASAGSVAIGLGAQSVVTDMLEGFFIFFEDHFAVGDIVTIQNITGTVESVSLRYTKIRDAQGKVHIIPNGSVGIVTNMSSDFMNAVVTIGIAYEENIDRVMEILKDEMDKTSDIDGIMEPPVIVGIVGLDESAVSIRIVTKCQIKTNFAVEVELRRRIKNRLDKEGVAIPFPQRSIHIIQEKEK